MGHLITKSSNALVVNNTQVPPGCHGVVATAMGLSVGDQVRVFASFTETRDAVFAQVAVGDGTAELRVFERVKGADHQIGETQTLGGIGPGEWFKLGICCDEGDVVGMAAGEKGTIARCRTRSEVAGSRFALGSGVVVGEIRFDDVRCLKHYPASCTEHPIVAEAGCPACGRVCPCCDIDVEMN